NKLEKRCSIQSATALLFLAYVYHAGQKSI
ncbi:hypothetical protein ACUW9G_002210, partial [Staphylococcus schleiferi]